MWGFSNSCYHCGGSPQHGGRKLHLESPTSGILPPVYSGFPRSPAAKWQEDLVVAVSGKGPMTFSLLPGESLYSHIAVF